MKTETHKLAQTVRAALGVYGALYFCLMILGVIGILFKVTEPMSFKIEFSDLMYFAFAVAGIAGQFIE